MNSGFTSRYHNLAIVFSTYMIIFSLSWRNLVTILPGITIINFFAIITTILWILKILYTKNVNSPTIFHILYFLLSIWVVITVPWAIQYEYFRPINTAVGFVLTFGIVFIIWDTYNKKWHLQGALQSFIFGSSLIIMGLFSAFFQGNVSVGAARYQTFIIANYIPLYLVTGSLFATYLLSDDGVVCRVKVFRYINYIFIPASIVGVFLTGSRQGFIMMGVLFIYLLYTIGIKWPTKIHQFLITLPLFIYIVYIIVPDENITRVATISPDLIEQGLNNRLDRWIASYETLLQYPYTGTGIGTNRHILEKTIGEYVTTHNSFLRLGHETGIVGLLLFTFCFYLAFRYSISQKNSIFCLMVLAGLLILNIFNDWHNRPELWIILNFIIVLYHMENNERTYRNLNHETS